MRVAFYAPLKPPDHPSPSGDRRMARLLMRALEAAGHDVKLASRLRSFDGKGDAARQRKLRALGGRMAQRLIRLYLRRPRYQRPQVWFTYHLYHKAPDWLGPAVSSALNIPYVVAEASYAPKQKNGPWAEGFDAAARAIALADIVFCPNSNDLSCVRPIIGDPQRLVSLTPFIETARFAVPAQDISMHRQKLSARHDIKADVPWMLCVAMMRPGDKLASYQLLGAALAKLADRPWRLLVCGHGKAHEDVEAALASVGDRVSWLGEVEAEDLTIIYAACDLYVWPAINEAYGMAFLEAQAGGLAVVAGRAGGVPDVVSDGETGVLVPVNDAEAFAAAVGELLDDDQKRREMSVVAVKRVQDRHDITGASQTLDVALKRILS